MVPIRIGVGSENFLGDAGYPMAIAEGVLQVVTLFLLLAKAQFPFEDHGRTVYGDRMTIFRHYVKTWLVYDVVSGLPLNCILAPVLGIDHAWTRVNSILMFMQASHAMSCIQEEYLSFIHPTAFRIFHFVTVVLLVINSCTAPLTLILRADIEGTERWLRQPYPGPTTTYIRAWAINLQIASGRDSGYPITDDQIVFLIPMSFVGLVVSSIVIAGVTQMIVSMVEASSQLQNKLDGAIIELQRQGVGDEFTEEVLQYYKKMWAVCATFDYNNNDDLLIEIPEDLKAEVEFSINVGIIKNIPLFAATSSNEAFASALATRLQMEIFLPGVIIFEAGEEGDSMYFIAKGEATILNDLYEPSGITLREGAFFGEAALLFGYPRMVTIAAETLCVMYGLQKDYFDELIDTFPQALETILVSALQRHKEDGPVVDDTSSITSGQELDLLSSVMESALGDIRRQNESFAAVSELGDLPTPDVGSFSSWKVKKNSPVPGAQRIVSPAHSNDAGGRHLANPLQPQQRDTDDSDLSETDSQLLRTPNDRRSHASSATSGTSTTLSDVQPLRRHTSGWGSGRLRSRGSIFVRKATLRRLEDMPLSAGANTDGHYTHNPTMTRSRHSITGLQFEYQ